MTEEHPFGDAEDVDEKSSPYGEPLEGYTPHRQWVRLANGKSVPRDWIREPQEGRTMTTTAIERVSDTPTVTAEQLALIKATVAVGATDAELKLFLFDCARQGVHPLDRLVHFTKRSGKYTPITSIDFMRIRAAESGEYAGSDVPLYAGKDGVWSSLWASEAPPFAALVTVWRLVQGTRCKFEAVARWAEYKPDANDFMWKKMPATMLAKCAEALALRKGFPRQLAGLYAKEEMDQAESAPHGRVAELVDAAPVQKGPAPRVDPPAAVHAGSSPALATNAPPEPDFELPPGFALIDDVKQDGVFLQVWWGRDAKGGWMKYSTKKPEVLKAAKEAHEERVPVKLHSKDGKYLDKVERLDGGMSKAELAATKWTPEQLENQSL